jgi:solute carrier family 25 carnitine/acylcarnitine transporter 20/29
MSFLPDLVAGTFAGFGICAVGHPFDTLKVMLQTQPDKYRGMGDAARSTLAQYGVGGLYRGVASPLVGMGIFNAVQFAVFGAAKAFTTNNGQNPSLGNVAAAAAGTGVVVAFVEGPQTSSSARCRRRAWTPPRASPATRALQTACAPLCASAACWARCRALTPPLRATWWA